MPRWIASTPRPSLYDQFGGRPGVEALVEELLVRVLGEPQIGVTRGSPTPYLDSIEASRWLRDNFIPEGQRARLFDVDGILVAVDHPDHEHTASTDRPEPFGDDRSAARGQPEADSLGVEIERQR